MKRAYRRLKCWMRGHKPHTTEIYHVSYGDGGYDTSAGGYVIGRSRCGKRLGVQP